MNILYPCKAGWGSQEFHLKDSKRNAHYGLDFGWLTNNDDDSIIACEDATVQYEGYWTDVIGGKEYHPIMVMLYHGSLDGQYDYYSLYTHLASTCCSKGDKIVKGQKIGMKGNTGYSFGKHLHFGFFRVNKSQPLTNWHTQAIDPLPYMYRTTEQIYKEESSVFKIPIENPVERDETKHQVRVAVNGLRLRASHNTDSEIKRIIENGTLFNVVDVFEDDYRWLDVEVGWIATKAEWVEEYFPKDTDELKEAKKTISVLKDMNKALDEANKKLQENNNALEEKLKKIGAIVNE